MDIKVRTEVLPNIGTMIIDNIDGPSADVAVKIYMPIRKGLIRDYGMAPTIVPNSQGKKTSITISFLSGSEVDDRLIVFAMNDFERNFKEFQRSGLSLEQFVDRMETELGITEREDISTVTPSKIWLKDHTVKQAGPPPFAIAR